MVKGSSKRDGEGRVSKYLAHGLKIRRASFTVRCISTNSVYEGDEREGGGIFSLTSPSLCRRFFSFYSGRGEITPELRGEKVLICRRPRIRPAAILSLFVWISLNFSSRNAKLESVGGGRRALIRVTSSFFLRCLYCASYYCQWIFFFF